MVVCHDRAYELWISDMFSLLETVIYLINYILVMAEILILLKRMAMMKVKLFESVISFLKSSVFQIGETLFASKSHHLVPITFSNKSWLIVYTFPLYVVFPFNKLLEVLVVKYTPVVLYLCGKMEFLSWT